MAFGSHVWLPGQPLTALTCTGTMITSWPHATAALSMPVHPCPGVQPGPLTLTPFSPRESTRFRALRLPSLAPSPLQGGPPHALRTLRRP